MLTTHHLKLTSHQALLWALTCVVFEWLIWSPPSGLKAELTRLGLHCAVGVTLTLAIALLDYAGRVCARLTSLPA